MKFKLLSFFLLYTIGVVNAQITSPPDFPVRTMAEWEEIQAITVTWTTYPNILAEIIRHSKEECRVIVICTDSLAVKNSLLDTYNFDNLHNIEYLEAPYDRVWIRDYGPHSMYANDTDSLILMDWIYNRDRPKDDSIPIIIGEYLNLPVYSSSAEPYELVATGGNFMPDGAGTILSSKLILDDNGPGNPFTTNPLDEPGVKNLMNSFMGIDQYILFERLYLDPIDHVDMHLRFLDESTILVGEYPEGIADGPEIEFNLQYLQENFTSPFGTPYNIVRIPMPSDNGDFPGYPGFGDYRTYTNSVFVNKTILIPTYGAPEDDLAFQIYESYFPGYKLVGIDCNEIIGNHGALHCITKAVGVNDPLRIVHQAIQDQNNLISDFAVSALIQHRSGIASAKLHYRLKGETSYTSIAMEATGDDFWVAQIPNTNAPDIYQYYIEGEAFSGKTINRPMPAPEAYWEFSSDTTVNVGNEKKEIRIFHQPAFPNPSHQKLFIPIYQEYAGFLHLSLIDPFGQEKSLLLEDYQKAGIYQYSFEVGNYPKGIYFIKCSTPDRIELQSIVIH